MKVCNLPFTVLPTVTATGTVTNIDAEPDLFASASDTAVTVTVEGPGTAAGPTYRPEDEITPTVELPPFMPLISQVTDVFDVPETMAVNCFGWPTGTVADDGDTETVIGAGGVDDPPPHPASQRSSKITLIALKVEPKLLLNTPGDRRDKTCEPGRPASRLISSFSGPRMRAA
jgi:hypothetical protein